MNNKLVILQVTNRLPYPLNDGGNIATYNVTKYLNRFGHRMILASLNTKKHYQDPKPLAQVAKVYTTDIDTTLTMPGLLKGIFEATPYNIKRFISEEFKSLLGKIIAEEKPDIVQLEGIYLAVYIDTIRKHTSAPIVLRSHNIEYEIWKRGAENEKNAFKRWYLKNLSAKIKNFEQEHLHQFRAIIAITERDAEFYRKNNFKGKIKTVTAGVDFELIHTAQNTPTTLSLCFLGSMEWMPNVQGIEWYLEKVWPTLHQKHPSLTLHIAGKGMSEEMKNRKISGVTFHGMVENANNFLNQHPIMIVPLLSGGGMRLKIVEAMAAGCCIVATSIGAEGIEATNLSEIIIADSPEENIQRIEELLSGSLSSAGIASKAAQLAREKYSWEKLVREIENFYLELI